MTFRRHNLRIAAIGVSYIALTTPVIASGEPRWIPGMPIVAPWSGTPIVQSMAVFDDGTGAALYVGGGVQYPAGPPNKGFARWDGSKWSAVGTGFDGLPHVVNVLDTGAGSALFVAGSGIELDGFDWAVVKWDGKAWAGVAPTSGTFAPNGIRDLEYFDDGNGAGPALFVGSSDFSVDAGSPTSAIVKWTGAAWEPLGMGLRSADFTQLAFTLAISDDGPHETSLIVGGYFDTAGSVAAHNVARWNGSQWRAIGPGPALDHVYDLKFYEIEVQGPDRVVLLAAGKAPQGSYQGVVMWDGLAWAPFGPATVSWGKSLEVLAFGGQQDLYVAGNVFPTGDFGGLVHGVAQWDGAGWRALGGGLTFESDSPFLAHSLTTFQDGTSVGPAIFVGGQYFNAAGGYSAQGVARWGVPIEPSCVPDIAPSGGDGRINIADLLQVISGWGTCDHPCGSDCVPDVDGSCAVNIGDLLAVIGQWGPCPGSTWE